jgi:hypothetical protein
MKNGRVLAHSVIATAGVVALGLAATAACGDIFHSTDFPTLCDRDASAPGCSGDAGQSVDAFVEAATDFCQWSSSAAASKAAHACAWLSACELPLGNDAFGPCMMQAILAYDCVANPNRPVVGKLHRFWDALWQATSCTDVDAVVFPGKPQPCINDSGTACGAVDGFGDNTSTRAECVKTGAPGAGEPCIMVGRTCDTATARCDVGSACSTSTCNGTVLHDCEDAGDLGLDCQYFGAGSCTAAAGYPACRPAGGGAPCAASTAVTCNQGQASGCATGVTETISCALLGGSSGGSCVAGTPSPMWDISVACVGNSLGDGGQDAGEAGVCVTATCGDMDTLTGCARGFTYRTSCQDAGLGQCVSVTSADGPSAACTKLP